MVHSPTFKPFGETALLISWPAQMNESMLTEVIDLNRQIEQHQISGVVETIPSIHSITIVFDRQSTNFDALKVNIEALYQVDAIEKQPDNYIRWKIPVCYDEQFGLDLHEVSDHTKLSIPEIIKIHAQSSYRVYSIGFLPGFLYLGGLDHRLHMDRKSTPRLKITKGAVGIGGAQTGIYPSDSPGGWQIIGNTPVPLFDVNKEVPCFARPGDKIQFTQCSLSDYQAISERIKLDGYRIEKEVIGD
jgi:inhibitor of KinA